LNRRLTVIRIAEDYPFGKPSYGLQPVYYYLSKEQARQGYSVHVIAREAPSRPKDEETDGVVVHRVGPHFNLNAPKLIEGIVGSSKNYVVHTHSTSGLSFGLLKKVRKFKMVSHVHGTTVSRHWPVRIEFGADSSLLRTWYYYTRERFLWSSADRALSVSNVVKSDLESIYKIPSQKIAVVYNGVDEKIFRPITNPEIPENLRKATYKKIILYVGHFGPRKGILYLIRAMRKIVEKSPNAILVCIGGVPSWLRKRENYWTALEREIKSNNLEGKVFLMDRVPNDALPSYYSIASVFVLPSYYEAFAKVVIEAMACAKPVVVTREGGPAESVVDQESGFLINYGSSNEIADSVLRVLDDEKLASNMGRRARQIVETKFTWSHVVKLISTAYDNLA
jgi:glycogen(starch) synthase